MKKCWCARFVLQALGTGTPETFTAITRIKDNCLPQNRKKIGVGCRIIEIDNIVVTTWSFSQVVTKLQDLQRRHKSHVKFKICFPLMSLPVSPQIQLSDQQSRHSETLTPVETPDPMPLSRRSLPTNSSGRSSRVDDFSSLDAPSDDDEDRQETLASVALVSPWRIRWSKETEVVTIKKTIRNQPKIGLTYKYKNVVIITVCLLSKVSLMICSVCVLVYTV